MTMLICTKHHLSNIWRSIHEKDWVEKSVGYIKCVYISEYMKQWELKNIDLLGNPKAKFGKIFKDTFFTEHLRATVSGFTTVIISIFYFK